ncbi:hypothetical protein HGRIS_005505 [Hohenbuehelia grisea]|uniref:CBF1-interacting co-repressor CIR N-terminal domain-containing protein n=1 Tax=Hohenbuehelia grisea TaxID=104357 RepID=A0ABR3JX77_9AGAR
MGKLNIAHHKSYHPYRRDNIERVRRDEEEARAKEAQEEGRMLLADSEARIDLLRERAGIHAASSSKKPRRKDEEKELDRAIIRGSAAAEAGPSLPTTGGHINFFEDLELSAIPAATVNKKGDLVETEKGVPLAPSSKDLNPWYAAREEEKLDDAAEQRRKRDKARQAMHDPLTSIARELASHSSSSASSSSRPRMQPPRPSGSAPAPVAARIARESSERERALALIARKRKEARGSETPNTVHGGVEDEGYADQFNHDAVVAAHRRRERGWEYDGGRDCGRDRPRERERERGWNRRDETRGSQSRDRRW